MLADHRSDAIVDNFASQWLQLRNLRGVIPDPDIFPDFDDNLRQAMVTETQMFFESIMREDHSVLDLLTADYSFVNERLARHYNIPNVTGSRFRKVALTDPNRRGLLGQASILTLTSVAVRTSPVARGKWVLTNLIGTPPPPPPPNVPALKEDKNGAPRSMRDRMTEHRKNPFCANCHKVMDPIGFALENFDAVGRYRSTDGGAAIDANDTMFNGYKADGAPGMRGFLTARPEVFVQTVTERLMTYALGRGLEYYDMPAVRKIVRDSARNNYKFSSIVFGIVRSVPFQMRLKAAAGAQSAEARTGDPALLATTAR
jgi:hypothetical protein